MVGGPKFRKLKFKEQPQFGQPLKGEDLSFEKLTLKEKLLVFASGLASDFPLGLPLDYIYHPHRYKVAPLFENSLESLYALVSESARVGDIKKVSKKDGVYLQVTAEGKAFLKREFPVFRWQGVKWDKLWRMVAYDIEEVRKDVRNSLRWKLEELGFAMLQRSLWVTPHDVTQPLREFLESEQLVPEVCVLEAKRLFAGDDRSLAGHLWPIKELNLAYKDWLARARKVGKSRKARTEFKEEFLEILKADPCLPKDLLPEGWVGEKAVEQFQKL